MPRYAVVLETTRTGYSAYSPDVPGCIATGRTSDEALKRMREALEFHLEGLRLEGLPIPRATSQVRRVSVTTRRSRAAERTRPKKTSPAKA